MIEPWHQIIQYFKNEIGIFGALRTKFSFYPDKRAFKRVQEILEQVLNINFVDDVVAQLLVETGVLFDEWLKWIVVPVKLKKVFDFIN